jgi:glycosyltransferase involved in cell wall biosynthesis
MAGSGIRAWNLARVIGAQQPVTLATINDVTLTPPPGVSLHSYAASDESARGRMLADLIAAHDVVIAQHIPYLYTDPEVLSERFLIVDLYAPWVLEKLEFARIDADFGEADRKDDVAILNRLLRLGDAFICASERQRDFWLGALAAANRLDSALAAIDPTLRNLIDVVPFGLPSEPPLRSGPGPREQFAAIGYEAKLILWNGGVWNWLDPFTAIEAMEFVVQREPRARLVFMGVRSPSEVVAPMRVVEEARAMAERLGLIDRVVFFNEWVPYDARQNWLLDADLGLSLHQPSLEARFAYRTRMLDSLWCGLPLIATTGDVLADLIEDAAIGCTAPPGDVRAVADAILQALDSDNQATYRDNLKRIAPEHSWEAVAQPLLSWCAQPPTSGNAHGADPRDDYLHRLERTYSETADYARHLERTIADKDRQLAAQELTLRNLTGAAKRKLRHLLPG